MWPLPNRQTNRSEDGTLPGLDVTFGDPDPIEVLKWNGRPIDMDALVEMVEAFKLRKELGHD